MSELDFTLSLIDNITKPIRQVQSIFANFAHDSQVAFGKMAIGGAGLVGAFWSVKSILDPAIEMNQAMMSASLQGIDSGVMDKIGKDALKFAAQYGKSPIDFVNSTTAISKAINHVNQQDLPQLTRITNTTAAALKSTPEEATQYMGQMFNQFESYANQIGQVQFAEALAGKAVTMSKAFGISMAEIASLMEGARNAGTQFGMGIDEQLAVLGELQRTLGGESAGAAANIMMGISRLIMTGLTVTMSLFTGVLKIGPAFVWLYRGAILAWNSALTLRAYPNRDLSGEHSWQYALRPWSRGSVFHL